MRHPVTAIALVFCLVSGAALRPVPAFAQQTEGTIRSIKVEGNQRVEDRTIMSYLLVSPGNAFDAKRIDLSLKALFATGLFADARFDREGDDMPLPFLLDELLDFRPLGGDALQVVRLQHGFAPDLALRVDPIDRGVADQGREPVSKTGALFIFSVGIKSLPQFQRNLLPGILQVHVPESHVQENLCDETLVVNEKFVPALASTLRFGLLDERMPGWQAIGIHRHGDLAFGFFTDRPGCHEGFRERCRVQNNHMAGEKTSFLPCPLSGSLTFTLMDKYSE